MDNEVKLLALLERLCEGVEAIAKVVSGDNDTKEISAANPEKRSENNMSEFGSVKTRDKTRYIYNEKICLKNRLVFNVVNDYVKTRPAILRDELKRVFPKDLQGSIGVIENAEVAEQRSDYKVRFFADEDEVLTLADGKMYVCSQWGIINIPRFIQRAEKLGFVIIEDKG